MYNITNYYSYMYYLILLEDASGEGEQECWFGEGECLELSEMESGSWRDCC